VVAVVVADVVPAVVPVAAVVVRPAPTVTVTPGLVLGMAYDIVEEDHVSNMLQRAREAGRPRLGC
jgi:hypothetical protein